MLIILLDSRFVDDLRDGLYNEEFKFFNPPAFMYDKPEAFNYQDIGKGFLRGDLLLSVSLLSFFTMMLIKLASTGRPSYLHCANCRYGIR